jgi:hypothetical protein
LEGPRRWPKSSLSHTTLNAAQMKWGCITRIFAFFLGMGTGGFVCLEAIQEEVYIFPSNSHFHSLHRYTRTITYEDIRISSLQKKKPFSSNRGAGVGAIVLLCLDFLFMFYLSCYFFSFLTCSGYDRQHCFGFWTE